MESNDLEKKGFMEKLIMKTPNGGDYSEAHFFDENWEYTTKDKAEHMIIRELKMDGTLLYETFMNRTLPVLENNQITK